MLFVVLPQPVLHLLLLLAEFWCIIAFRVLDLEGVHCMISTLYGFHVRLRNVSIRQFLLLLLLHWIAYNKVIKNRACHKAQGKGIWYCSSRFHRVANRLNFIIPINYPRRTRNILIYISIIDNGQRKMGVVKVILKYQNPMHFRIFVLEGTKFPMLIDSWT